MVVIITSMEMPTVSASDDYFSKLKNLLAAATTRPKLYEAVVNAPFHDPRRTTMLGLGITVLLLVNKRDRMIDRVALANTDMAAGTLEMSAKPFNEIRIPLGYRRNFIARAIIDKHYMITSDWQYIFNPVLTPEEARFNQAGGGIDCSVIYPLIGAGDGGAMIFSYYEGLDRITKEHHNFMSRYCIMVSKALNSLSD